MPLYYYESYTRAGKQVTGTIDAPTPQGAKEMLQGQGLLPTTIIPAQNAGTGFSFAGLFARKVEEKNGYHLYQAACSASSLGSAVGSVA